MKKANQTILELQQETNGFSEGFDYLRIALAVVILLIHSISLATMDNPTRGLWFGNLRFLLAFSLPMFFCLSGFLVAASLVRNSLFVFCMLRVLRIVPALAFETILCAICLGGFFTILPAADYFQSKEFFAYFGNIVGFIHYTLPGVFSGRALNVQLWTIPFELECYLALLCLSVLGLIRNRLVFLIAVGAFLLFLTGFYLDRPYPADQPQGRVLVCGFLVGVAFYLFRDRIILSKPLFAAAAISSALLLNYPALNPIAMVPLCYVTVFLGLLRGRKLEFGDYSYGIYLFHYPVIRTFSEIFEYRAPWSIVFPLCLIISTILSMISWKLVESPVLKRKKSIISNCDRYLRMIFVPSAETR